MRNFSRRFLRQLHIKEDGSIGYMADPEEITVSDVAAQSFAAVATLITKTAVFPVDIVDFVARVTVSPTVTAVVLALTATPLGGAESAAKATITIPVAAIIGSIWRNPLTDNGKNFRLNIGDVLKAKVTSAATAGTGNVWVIMRRSQQLPPAIAAATYNEVSS